MSSDQFADFDRLGKTQAPGKINIKDAGLAINGSDGVGDRTNGP